MVSHENCNFMRRETLDCPLESCIILQCLHMQVVGVGEVPWLKGVSTGLRDILSSKVGEWIASIAYVFILFFYRNT